MVFSKILLTASVLLATSAAAEQAQLKAPTLDNHVVSLNLPQTKEAHEAFEKVYNEYLKDFDADAYHSFLEKMEAGLENYKSSNAFNGYKTIPGQPHCDRGVISTQTKAAMGAKAVSAFPGGAMKALFGFDMGKFVYQLSQKAAGPAAASGGMAGVLAMQALAMGAGMLQAGVASAIHIIPPMIPFWNQPLSCLPMITGHNCFGAVLHLITMADFVIADVTDSMMDGYIAGFPATYAQKVGKTSDAMYKTCFSTYMSMMCSSLFPRCTSPNSREEPVPAIGRVPMCFTLCVATLVMCPGFWVEDVLGPCQMVAPPPTCSMAVFWNIWKLPPQYVTFSESHPAPLECPKTDAAASGGLDASTDYGLYDDGREAAGQSPFQLAAAAGAGGAGAVGATTSIKLPNA